MNDPKLLRAHLRRVMAFNPERQFSEEMLFVSLGQVSIEPLTVNELKGAIQWNRTNGLMESAADADGETVWKLTDAGKAREGIK